MDAAAYVCACQGRPWSTERHCWDLVGDAQRVLFGRAMPAVWIDDALDAAQLARIFRDALRDRPERRNWRRVEAPAHGAVVLMARGKARARAIHAGIYLDLDGGGVLHVDGGHGTEFVDLFTLSRLRGWDCEFYVPAAPDAPPV